MRISLKHVADTDLEVGAVGTGSVFTFVQVHHSIVITQGYLESGHLESDTSAKICVEPVVVLVVVVVVCSICGTLADTAA